MDITFQASVIFVSDISVSREFYENLLGMEILMDHGENVLYHGGLSIWQADLAFQIIFGTGQKDSSKPGRNNLELYFETKDLEAARDKLEKSGVDFIQEIHEEPWRQRTLRIADPDGHLIEIGEPMTEVIRRFLSSGMAPETVALETSMPLEAVKNILNEE